MAIIKAMVGQEVISGFRGVIDFYLWCGIPCARRWPRSPGHDRTSLVMAQWPAFTIAAALWNQTSPIVRDAYNFLAPDTGLTGRDWFMRGYLSGIFRYEHD